MLNNPRECTTEELISSLNTISWLWGIVSGMEDISSEMKTRAGGLFADGKDDDALLYRGLSKTVKALAEIKRKELNEQQESIKQEIWEELGRRINLEVTRKQEED